MTNVVMSLVALEDFSYFELEQSILRLQCTEMKAIADGT